MHILSGRKPAGRKRAISLQHRARSDGLEQHTVGRLCGRSADCRPLLPVIARFHPARFGSLAMYTGHKGTNKSDHTKRQHNNNYRSEITKRPERYSMRHSSRSPSSRSISLALYLRGRRRWLDRCLRLTVDRSSPSPRRAVPLAPGEPLPPPPAAAGRVRRRRSQGQQWRRKTGACSGEPAANSPAPPGLSTCPAAHRPPTLHPDGRPGPVQ